MAFTSHGHQIVGSIAQPGANRSVARCGGPGICGPCSSEAVAWAKLAERLNFFKGQRVGIFVYGPTGEVDAEATHQLIAFINAKILEGTSNGKK